MKPELKEKIVAFNRRRKEVEEKASDFQTLLNALPFGQIVNLQKDPTCAEILKKYGIR